MSFIRLRIGSSDGLWTVGFRKVRTVEYLVPVVGQGTELKLPPKHDAVKTYRGNEGNDSQSCRPQTSGQIYKLPFSVKRTIQPTTQLSVQPLTWPKYSLL